jgi:threonine aldolase
LASENTHLASGGSILPFEHIKSLSKISKSNGLKFHMDGARIWHAILTDPQSIEYGKYCDSLTFCFSKGLGAPIGSMLMGDKNFINEAREYRKKLGGGMRQVGIIASAARYAIENRDHLLEDHKKASDVNNSIEKDNRSFHTATYKGTNMLFFSFDTTDSAEIFRKKLEEKNIISGFIKKDIIRLVFHKDVEIDKVDSIVEAINYSSSIDI